MSKYLCNNVHWICNQNTTFKNQLSSAFQNSWKVSNSVLQTYRIMYVTEEPTAQKRCVLAKTQITLQLLRSFLLFPSPSSQVLRPSAAERGRPRGGGGPDHPASMAGLSVYIAALHSVIHLASQGWTPKWKGGVRVCVSVCVCVSGWGEEIGWGGG